MSVAKVRSPRTVPAAVLCAAALAATSMMAAASGVGVRTLIAEAVLLANDGLINGFIMGGTGNPLPDPVYIGQVEGLYLQPSPPLFLGQPTFPSPEYTFEGLSTPEQFCPVVCLPAPNPDLTFGDSLNQGVTALNNAILPPLENGENVAVLGYSQSATVASVEMNNLLSNPPASELYDPSKLHVVLLGDPNSPIGGILDRFQFPAGVGTDSLDSAPQHLPFLNVPLGLDPTPTGPFPTDIYTGEYDGYGDFPEDPSNILADINALVGIETVHPYYPDPDPTVNLDTGDIIDLGKIGDTTFYEIPAPLPILAFMYDGGPAGQFFYDAFNPSLSLNIDWSYGNPGDPGVGVNGTDAIGPWQVDATGQLMASGVAGFLPKMDPLQMLAGAEYANVQSLVNPIDDLLRDAGQATLPNSFVNSLLSGYDFTNQLDTSLLTEWTNLTASMPTLAPDAILDGSPLISGQPLIDLVGLGFDAFNFFGA